MQWADGQRETTEYMNDQCDHAGYDKHLNKCLDCGKTQQQIHDTECEPAGFNTTEASHGLFAVLACAACGLELEPSVPRHVLGAAAIARGGHADAPSAR